MWNFKCACGLTALLLVGCGGDGGSGNSSSSNSSSASSSSSSSSSSSASSGQGGLSCLPTHERSPLLAGPQNCPGYNGLLALDTAEFCAYLDPASQTLARLIPKSQMDFDFAPYDQRNQRNGNGFMQLGDLTLRYRTQGSTAWQNAATHNARQPVAALGTSTTQLAAADLAATLPGGLPLKVTRQWVNESGRLALRFTLQNDSPNTVEVGALGMPMVFNNIITGRNLDQAHAVNTFVDPYIGFDAGYLQVTRFNGAGPAMLVLPESGTALEAYNPIFNPPEFNTGGSNSTPIFTDRTRRNLTFEGFYEWLAYSRAYADNEWQGVEPWNAPNQLVLAPGESKTVGLQFALSDSIRNIESTLVRERRPVAVGLPGYILPGDVQGNLYLNYPEAVAAITVEPAAALTITPQASTDNCWQAYAVSGEQSGRARLTIRYEDDTVQTVHYNITKPAADAVADMGAFLTSKAWYVNDNDPFGRSPAVMTYDIETDDVVDQERRAWVAGLGDDGGAVWLAGIMKLSGQPDAGQIAQYETFVDEVVWGNLQYSTGPLQYGVKRTLFYYEPGLLPGYYDNSIDWNFWGAWSKAHIEQVPRSYNYPHVTALYWTLYRLARNTQGLVTHHNWDWYLNQSYRTAVAMTTVGSQYAEFGVMDGSIFLTLLTDLEREGWQAEAGDLRARMRDRADHWAQLNFPFGSEMPWDSTGQEEVYLWTRHFGNDSKKDVTLNAILGYMPTVPHWGYNGSARRYWDFVYGGSKLDRIERMLHHYGSSLNAIPVLTEYRDNPDDFYLLRTGYAGMMGPMSNISQEGFPAMAFHAFPDTLAWDARTGDYGLAFYGHSYGSGAYLIDHPEFGWQGFGGSVEGSAAGGTVRLVPQDAFRQRVYISPLGLWLTLDAGRFQAIELQPESGVVDVILDPDDGHTPNAVLRIEQPAAVPGIGQYQAPGSYSRARGAVLVPLGSGNTSIRLQQ